MSICIFTVESVWNLERSWTNWRPVTDSRKIKGLHAFILNSMQLKTRLLTINWHSSKEICLNLIIYLGYILYLESEWQRLRRRWRHSQIFRHQPQIWRRCQLHILQRLSLITMRRLLPPYRASDLMERLIDTWQHMELLWVLQLSSLAHRQLVLLVQAYRPKLLVNWVNMSNHWEWLLENFFLTEFYVVQSINFANKNRMNLPLTTMQMEY